MLKIHPAKVFFFFLFSLLIGNLYGQSRYKKLLPQQHAITLQLADLHYQPDLGRYAAPVRVGYDVANGLQYSFQVTPWDGIRAGGAYRRARFDGPADNNVGLESFAASRQDLDFSLDYIRQFGLRETRLYGGAGILFRLGQEKNEAIRPGDLNQVVVSSEYAYQAWGGRLLLGLRHYFSSNVSLGLEATGFAVATGETSTPDPTSWPSPMLAGLEWGVTSSVLLAFHFGRMKKHCRCPKH